MKPKDRLFKAINFEETDRPPHFELKYELVEEAFNLSFPDSGAVLASSGRERLALFEKSALIYAKTFEKFKWDGICIWTPNTEHTSLPEFTAFLKKYLGDGVPLAPSVWHSGIAIETVNDYMQFSIDLVEEPDKLHRWAGEMCKRALEDCRQHIDAGCDLITLPLDVAFNAGPFLSPQNFAEFNAPYLKRIVDFVHNQGIKIIFHTDGNLMPILDQIIEIRPDVLQSIDPMAGMDIAEVKRLTYGKVALMGNVQCSLLQDGPAGKIIESAQYALEHGCPGGGFIYSTSNTIFKGLPLENYELMLDTMHRFSDKKRRKQQ